MLLLLLLGALLASPPAPAPLHAHSPPTLLSTPPVGPPILTTAPAPYAEPHPTPRAPSLLGRTDLRTPSTCSTPAAHRIPPGVTKRRRATSPASPPRPQRPRSPSEPSSQPPVTPDRTCYALVCSSPTPLPPQDTLPAQAVTISFRQLPHHRPRPNFFTATGERASTAPTTHDRPGADGVHPS